MNRLEELVLACVGVFFLQLLKDSLNQRHRPTLLEELFGGRVMGWLAEVTILSRLVVPRNDRIFTTPFHRVSPIPVIGQKVPQRCQQEGAEPPALRLDGRQTILLQQAGEEFLREILCLMSIAPLPSHKGVKRIPIGLAEHGKRSHSLW